MEINISSRCAFRECPSAVEIHSKQLVSKRGSKAVEEGVTEISDPVGNVRLSPPEVGAGRLAASSCEVPHSLRGATPPFNASDHGVLRPFGPLRGVGSSEGFGGPDLSPLYGVSRGIHSGTEFLYFSYDSPNLFLKPGSSTRASRAWSSASPTSA